MKRLLSLSHYNGGVLSSVQETFCDWRAEAFTLSSPLAMLASAFPDMPRATVLERNFRKREFRTNLPEAALEPESVYSTVTGAFNGCPLQDCRVLHRRNQQVCVKLRPVSDRR